MPQDVDTGSSASGCVRRKGFVEAHSGETGSQCHYVIDRAVVGTVFFIKALSDIVVAGCNKSHYRNEPGGGAGGDLRHAKSFVNAARGTKDSQRDSVQVGF